MDRMDGLRAAGVMVLCAVIGSMTVLGTSVKPGTEAAADESDWTVMIYMAADVDKQLPWEQDINELEAAHQADGTNIVVLVDPPGTGDSRLMKIEHDDNYFDPTIVSTVLDDEGEVIPGGGEVNTGSPATLRDFIVYSYAQFPAENLVLVMWGHGAGWRGLCPDGYDLLTVPEFRSALYMTGEALGRGLDLVVLDVCLGATLELAFEIQDHADLLVASEVTVPSEGLPYMQIMNALASDPTASVGELAEVIAGEYIEWARYGSALPTAIGVIDLSRVQDVVDGLDELSRLGLGYDRLYHEDMAAAMRSSEYCEDEWSMDVAGISDGVCGTDLPLEMRHFSLQMALSAQSAVIHHETTLGAGADDGTDIDRAYGLGLYAPSAEDDEPYSELLIAGGWWDEFSVSLRSSRSDQPSNGTPVVTVDDSPTDSDPLPDVATITWPVEQFHDYSFYYAYVFQVRPQGLVLCSVVESATNIVRVEGVVGNLLVSTSAFIAGEAHSHQTLEVTLAKLIGIDVTIEFGALSAGRHLEIVTYLAGEEPKVSTCLNMSCVVYLITPYQVDVGEAVGVELVDADSGEVLAHRQVLMTGEDVAITLMVHEPALDTTGTTVLVSLIAALAMLGIAFVVYMNFLRRRP